MDAAGVADTGLLVALLAEGVGRNLYGYYQTKDLKEVALLAEGVGRNRHGFPDDNRDWESPSSRRAWVEIGRDADDRRLQLVALLAEGVGRNGNKLARQALGRSRPPRGGRG